MTCFATVVIGLVTVGQLDALTPSGSLSDELRNPAAVTVLTDGTILVTDLARDHVVRYDGSGSIIGTWSVPEGPMGIAAHSNGNYYIALRDEGTVGIYPHDSGTDTLVRAGSLGEGNAIVTFVGPTDVDVATDSGRIFVADAGGDTIYRFESDGSLPFRFGIRGDQMGRFQYPSAISVDETNDRVIVADQDNFRIQVFTIDGVYLFRFGHRNKYMPGGGEEGWMPRSQGLAVDAAGRIYVADAFMNTVRVFDDSGAELGKVLEYGSAPAGLRVPYGIALSPDEASLYVACVGTGAVQIYDAPVLALRSSGSAMSPGSGSELPGRSGTNWSAYDAAYRLGAAFFDWQGGRELMFKRASASDRNANSPVDQGDSEAAADRTNYNGPHMIEASIVCGRCHGIDGQPGGDERTVEGQVVICASCHGGDGQALEMPVMAAEDADPFGTNPSPMTGVGRSHPWGVSAVNGAVGSVGPSPGSLLDQHLKDGNIKCATCHDQHSMDAGSPYLRVNNANGTMCRQCHVDHIGHTPEGSWQPTCEECHGMHDMTSENLSLVATMVAGHPVIFTGTTGANSFSDGDATNDGICQVCHTATDYHREDGSGASHNEGAACTGCHPHDAGFMPSGACDACHGAPPATGAHLVHFGIADLGQVIYGGTDNVSTPSAYGFQCGTCHPLSFGLHNNGTVDVDLYDVAAPAGSLKSLNPDTAAYNSGGGTCSNVYCHSKTDWTSGTVESPLTDPVEGWILLDENGNLTYDPYTVNEFTVYMTVDWNGGSLDCNGCHRNPPQTVWPAVDASVGNSHAAVDDWGWENLHTYNMASDPLFCRVCHYDTVTDAMTWSRIGGDITIFEDVPIADKRFHVNGVKDVAFDPVNEVTYSTRTFGFGDSTYDPASKTCSNVGCHLEQCRPEWGKPYRLGFGSAECDQCHHYGGPWPPTSPCDGRDAADQSEHSVYGDGDCLECHTELHSSP